MSENLDHLFDEKEQNLNQDSLDKLSSLCLTYKVLEENILKLESDLKSKKEELEQVSRIHIPSILNEKGLKEIKLSTGEKVIVEDKLKASIANKNFMLAFNNMVKAEGGDDEAEEKVESLFKTKATIENVTEEILDTLLDNDISFDSKKEIHWQTLSKYCKDRIEKGEQIPDGISVFQYQETKIK